VGARMLRCRVRRWTIAPPELHSSPRGVTTGPADAGWPMARPRLTFWCELDADALRELLADGRVVDDLLALQAGVSLALSDLSASRAAAVRRLTACGVPVTAWLLLPRQDGYYCNLDNAPRAAARYEEFRGWTAEHGLRWAGVGLDVEPALEELQGFAATRRWRDLLPLLPRALDYAGARRGRRAYGDLIARMHADGYRVESYQFPLIVDDRKAGSTLVQRISRIVDLPVDREVLMLYSSFSKAFRQPLGPGILWSYAPDAQAIGVGSTGGGTEIPALDWEELARDLRLASRRTDDIAVFSLEGCVRRGWLTRLRTFEWDDPITPPLRTAKQVDRCRRVLRAVLWAEAHPVAVLGGVIGLAWVLRQGARMRGAAPSRSRAAPRTRRVAAWSGTTRS